MRISARDKLRCHTALIHNISLGVRAVFAVPNGRTLEIHFVLWRTPSDADLDCFEAVSGDLLAELDEFADATVVSTVSRAPLDKVVAGGDRLFVRAEELDGYPESIQFEDEERATPIDGR